MIDSYEGIILIDKNQDETSFDIVKKVRRVLNVKKVGHAGTLDPFATGLLVILLKQGTKLSPYLMSREKRYHAIVRLGVETDTRDPTGQVIQTTLVPEFEPEYIKEKTLGFVGEVEQVPPIYSAVNYEGKRAYNLARKGIKIELKKRKVKIHNIEVISIDLPDLTMEVSCSSGTYIRSLASDIGKRLGTGAHLKALRRLSSGSFEVKNSVNSRHIGLIPADSLFGDKIISLRDALPDMKEIHVDGRMAKKIRDGYQPEWRELVAGSCFPFFGEGYVKLVKGIKLVSIMEVRQLSGDDKWRLKTQRVFN